MKRTFTFVAVFLMTIGMLTLPAGAEGPHEHGHVLLVGADFEANPDFDPTDPSTGPPWFVEGYRKCVEIANGQALGIHVHHGSIHQGRAGEALRNAGHLTVPLYPLHPDPSFTDCAAVEAMLGDS